MRLFNIIFLILILLSFTFTIIGVILHSQQEVKVREVSCFDKHNNKVIGLTCEESHQEWTIGQIIGQVILVFGGMIIAFICGVILTFLFYNNI